MSSYNPSSRLRNGWLTPNVQGGLYQPGRRYDYVTKARVAAVYFNLMVDLYPNPPTQVTVAEYSQVSRIFAAKVMREVDRLGHIIDPEYEQKAQYVHNMSNKSKRRITRQESIFLLAMRMERPQRARIEYIAAFQEQFGKILHEATISRFFNSYYKFSGRMRKPNLVPVNKFTLRNLQRFVDFDRAIRRLPDRSKFIFLDEKHIVNKDVLATKVRGDPLDGYIPYIAVSGDFRDTYNVFAAISLNGAKQTNCAYLITKNNGTAVSFLKFVRDMVLSGFISHGDVMILDNAAIHIGGEAKVLENLVWNHVVNGRPLRVLLLFLPPRPPELNPIELIFHILSSRVKSFRYRSAGPSDHAVLKTATRVLDDIGQDVHLIWRCARHCGYL